MMRQIVEYRLVERLWISDNTRGESIGYINSEINTLLDQGWEPYGTPFSHNQKIVQAMVRYDSSELGMAYQAETLQALIDKVEQLEKRFEL